MSKLSMWKILSDQDWTWGCRRDGVSAAKHLVMDGVFLQLGDMGVGFILVCS